MIDTRGLHPTDKVADYLARGWWSRETADQLFRDRVAERADILAIVDPANRADILGAAPRRLTWQELDAEVTWLAARLLEIGLRRGDVLGVQLPNTIELVEAYLAAWTIGVVVSPLPMQYREHEVVEMARQASFGALLTVPVFADRSPAGAVVAVRDRLPSLRHVLTISQPGEGGGITGTHDLTPTAATVAERTRVEQHLASDPNDPNDCVTICWTSGTENTPKGVPRCHFDWLSVSWATVDAPRMVPDDILLNPFPMVNMAGITGLFLPWLRTGALLVQHHPFDVGVFLRQIAEERVTYTLAPPALLSVLLQNEQLLAANDLGSLTRIGSGSAPLQPAMVRGWQEKFGIGVINFFGSNEGLALLSSPEDFPDPEERAQFFPRYGTPGVSWSSRVSHWVGIKIIDPTTGNEVTEIGGAGELCIDGPTVFAGYLHGSDRPSPFDEAGMLRTGDMFEIAGDQGQYLRFVDRIKDIVIRGGMNIAPAELESLITEHPAVAEVAVIGDPDPVLGERVAAVVTLVNGASLTLTELTSFLRDRRIASYKLPERLEIRATLPRNPVGKLVKRQLRPSPGSGSVS
ncbi:class I adenylate-forming enzyme family protein [Nocardia sp. CNY236]|uniref:class I adenylate-forming enzyme family protein n=1 Tax=Nocardia sp. CNY236 TaxID=1169152 RepID=UPI00040C9EC5|nr:class I adenylate-forming enzyme family protein [Nocardia sp. CNY236]